MDKLIAVFLDGPIENDGRVRRLIESLSIDNIVHLFCMNGSENDINLFNGKVTLFKYSIHESWFIRNINFQKKFSEIELMIKKNGIQYNFLYCNDYPLLNTVVELKKEMPQAKIIYDSHEIYIETINQFFPVKDLKAIYGIPLIKLNKIYHSWLEKKLIPKVDFFVTVCESFKQYFEKKFNIENIIIVHNCPKLNKFPVKNNIIKEQLNLPENTFILLYQGNLNPGRGVEKMILLLPLLTENIHIVIIGDGFLKTMLQEMAFKSGKKNIHFLGAIKFNDLLNYTASADLGVMFIQPINKSKELTLPNKLFEYMAAGIPVLTNNLPEAKKIVTNVGCGYAIDDTSIKDVSAFINEIAHQRVNLSEMGIKGQVAILNEYNWDMEIQKLINIIKM